MQYRRLHIRVPASGEVILSVDEQVRVEATVINVSAGGLCITAPSYLLGENEYNIAIKTPAHGRIQFSGLPVYQTKESVGIKITYIDDDNLRIIYRLVENFRADRKTIQPGEQDFPQDRLMGDSCYDLSITFET